MGISIFIYGSFILFQLRLWQDLQHGSAEVFHVSVLREERVMLVLLLI